MTMQMQIELSIWRKAVLEPVLGPGLVGHVGRIFWPRCALRSRRLVFRCQVPIPPAPASPHGRIFVPIPRLAQHQLNTTLDGRKCCSSAAFSLPPPRASRQQLSLVATTSSQAQLLPRAARQQTRDSNSSGAAGQRPRIDADKPAPDEMHRLQPRLRDAAQPRDPTPDQAPASVLGHRPAIL